MGQWSNECAERVQSNLGEVVTAGEEIDQHTVVDVVKDLLDSYNLGAPQVIYNSDAWDIITETGMEDCDRQDWSGCETALDCVTQEANALLDATYRKYLDEALENIRQVVEEIEDEYPLATLKLGDPGLRGIPHIREDEFCDCVMYVWAIDGQLKGLITVEGLHLDVWIDAQEDVDDDE